MGHCGFVLPYRYSNAPARWGVYHASELQYIFDVQYPYLLGASGYTVAERVLMRGIQHMWAGVARGGTDATTHTPAWPVFSVEEPWVLQLEASSEADDLSERLWAVAEYSGNRSVARCSFWGHVAGHYGRDSAGAVSDGPSDDLDIGVAVLVLALIVLFACCFVGARQRHKALKSGSYKSLQSTDTQFDHMQSPASTSKTGDNLTTGSPP